MSQPTTPVLENQGVIPDPRGYRRVWIDYSVDVAAPEREVFALLSDVAGWASWAPGVRRIGRRGSHPILPGRRFSMLLRMPPLPMIITPCRMHVLSPARIEWGGGGLGSVICHRFEITPLGDARTRVRHVEYATNVLAIVLIPLQRIFIAHNRRWSAAIAAWFDAR